MSPPKVKGKKNPLLKQNQDSSRLVFPEQLKLYGNTRSGAKEYFKISRMTNHSITTYEGIDREEASALIQEPFVLKEQRKNKNFIFKIKAIAHAFGIFGAYLINAIKKP
ncbi:hypothetical protein MUP56_01430 [Patescibacteria group bacterium]|nr:hypothetical protein [Patescibacteria group bacterium]